MFTIFSRSLLNNFSRPHVWSNLVFLLPVTIAFTFGYYLEGVLLLLVFVVSMFYHLLSNEVNIQWVFMRKNVSTTELFLGSLDYIFAGLLGGGLFIRFVNHSDNSILVILLSILFLFSLIIFIWPLTVSRVCSISASHAIWHIIIAFIATIILVQ